MIFYIHLLLLLISGAAFLLYFSNKNKISIKLFIDIFLTITIVVIVFALFFFANKDLFNFSSFAEAFRASYQNLTNISIAKEFEAINNKGIIVVYIEKIFTIILVIIGFNLLNEKFKKP